MSINEEELNELNSFGCPLWAEDELEEIIEWMTDDILIYIDEEEYSYENKLGKYERSFPRFGIYSIILRNISVFLYDNPKLNDNFGNTACTDGSNIYIDFNFYKKLSKIESQNKENRLGVIPIILHEIGHIIESDLMRFPNVSNLMANIASDMYNNAYIKQSFPNIKWLPELINDGIGLRAGDEHYANKNSEYVLLDILKKINENISPEISQAEKLRIHSSKYISEEHGRTIDMIDNEMIKYMSIEKHTISKELLVKTLCDAGLSNIVNAFGIDLNNLDESIKNSRKITSKVIEQSIEIFEEIQKKSNFNDLNSPSGKLVKNIKQRLKIKETPNLNWKQVFKNKIWSEKGEQSYNNDLPNDMFYVDEVSDIMGFELYEGVVQQKKSNDVVLVILDTSASMIDPLVENSITEIFGMKNELKSDISTKDIVIVFADENIKENNVIILDENNYSNIIKNKKIDIVGRGGTNLTKSLNNALKIPYLKDKILSSVIYFTDLGDVAPKKKDIQLTDLQKNSSFTYISLSNNPVVISSFKNDVFNYANVYSLDGENKNIELRLKEERKQNSKKFKM